MRTVVDSLTCSPDVVNTVVSIFLMMQLDAIPAVAAAGPVGAAAATPTIGPTDAPASAIDAVESVGEARRGRPYGASTPPTELRYL